MRAEITRDGVLRILPENETEEYALDNWAKISGRPIEIKSPQEQQG